MRIVWLSWVHSLDEDTPQPTCLAHRVEPFDIYLATSLKRKPFCDWLNLKGNHALCHHEMCLEVWTIFAS